MINITIPNLPKLQKAYKRYPEVAQKEINGALLKSAYEIVGQTKPLTPFRTGRLRGSIGQVGGDGIFQIEKMSAMVGTNVEYAVKQHEGFFKHNIGQRLYLETGANKSMEKITTYFQQALDNVNAITARDSN